MLGIFLQGDSEAIIHRYFSDDADARYKKDIQENVLARLCEHEVRSLYMEGIFGCPHKEGIDSPEGEPYPTLPLLERKRSFRCGRMSSNPSMQVTQHFANAQGDPKSNCRRAGCLIFSH